MFFNSAAPDPTAIEQISLMINRYNLLTIEIKNIEDMQKNKELEIEQLKLNMTSEISDLKTHLAELKKLANTATKIKVNVGRDFKQIVKSDSFNRLSRRVDLLNFEKRISREELYRLLERK